VRSRDDETLVTDGPYAEVKEALGGFFVFECDSMDDALDWAARIPGAEHGAIEVGRSTSIPRRCSCEVRDAHLRRRLALGRPLPTRRGRAARRRDAAVDLALRGAPQGRSDRVGEGARRTKHAKVVRVRDGERLVTDGPYVETKEILGGVFLIDLPDLDEAIRLASLIPAAKDTGSIEIRPILQ
jgi:hypothetical protein